MTGSKLQRLAWALPVLVAIGVFAQLQNLRNQRATRNAPAPPSPATSAPTRLPAPPPAASAVEAEEARAVSRLHSELAQLRSRIAAREQQLRRSQETTSLRAAGLAEAFLSHDAWRDAGTATPVALIETALWAGAGGDVQRMSGLLAFDADALAAADRLLERMPADLRPAGIDGRGLIALLSVDAVPLTTARVVGDFAQEDDDHVLVLQLSPAEDAPAGSKRRTVKLTTRQDPATAQWRIVVPASAVERFGRQLGLPSP